jgi:uncharacterized protein (DUF488 family)
VSEHAVAAEPAPDLSPRTIWTIGHWSCPEPVFLHPLVEQDIELLVDIRALPGSRRSPQFDADQMPRWLDAAGIAYLPLPELGGRRKRQDVDPQLNAGWKNASFKNYADYSLTAPYRRGLDRLQALARERRTVLMCGEPMPWRCHRLLIATSLVVRGWTVWHLIGDDSPRRHELGRWGATPSVAADLNVTYPTD